ncbi:flagellar biosynthetic protein FliO [Paraglaciecola sp. 2405UD69-4]|uniref:flagellar biosynthetic protein FliO n=1 Tax=Paraglaciecola sp. 2405UD69-4 TaxID=3391836 RepID=UPI0039C8E4DB
MLLVNWKESKNSGKQKSYKTWAWCVLGPFLLLSNRAYSAAQDLTNPTSIVSIFLSLLLVVGVVFVVAFLMRRFNVTQSGSSDLKVVASMMAGTRERVMVIEVGNEQHLVGVTAHNINHLAKLEVPLANDSATGNDNFKDKLAMFMAGKLNPSVAENQESQTVSSPAANKEKK